MNVEPYSDDEIADARTHLSCDDEYDRCHYHDVAHWLATVDALRARLAAAEARAERAVGLLGDARKCVSLVNVNGYYDVWLARCYALLKEVSHGQQG